MKYFDHDTTATKDELIQALRLECGGAAVDAYWCILECIYRIEGDLSVGEDLPETKSVTHWLGVGWETFKEWFSTMGKVGLISVVENDVGIFTLHSERACENIAKYTKRKETARQNGMKGGRKPKGNRKQTKSVTERKPNPNQSLTQPKTKEKEKVLDTLRYPNTYTAVGAAAAEAAPPAAVECPNCNANMEQTASSKGGKHLYLCPLCAEEVWL